MIEQVWSESVNASDQIQVSDLWPNFWSRDANRSTWLNAKFEHSLSSMNLPNIESLGLIVVEIWLFEYSSGVEVAIFWGGAAVERNRKSKIATRESCVYYSRYIRKNHPIQPRFVGLVGLCVNISRKLITPSDHYLHYFPRHNKLCDICRFWLSFANYVATPAYRVTKSERAQLSQEKKPSLVKISQRFRQDMLSTDRQTDRQAGRLHGSPGQ